MDRPALAPIAVGARIAANVAMVAAACALACPSRALADPALYEPGLDPTVGVNLVSWNDFGASGVAVWEAAVQDVYDHGFRAVSIGPVRFVDLATGAVRASDGSTSGPDASHIAAAVAKATSLGMSVTIDPFVEPDGFSMWRAQMNFSGAAKARFWSDYRDYLLEMAGIAQAGNASRLLIGTELNALVEDPAHAADWVAVIDAVNAVFSGALGYAANWDDYRDANLTATIWENPSIDFLGVDTYHPLATASQASGPGQPAVALLESSWTSVLDDPAGGFARGILAFAAARKGGTGMPVVMTEHGTIPYDKTTSAPYSSGPAGNAADPHEQRNDYDALMRAADGRATLPASAGRVEEIHIWQWAMPGAEGSLWLLDPAGDDVTEGAKAAQFLAGFVTGMVPDPGQPQSKQQRACIVALDEALAKIARLQSKDIGGCVRDFAKARLAPQTVESCLTADRRQKIARASAAAVAAEAKSCTAPLPDFGATDAATVSQQGMEAPIALAHAIAGTDLDVSLATEAGARDTARCQMSVLPAAGRCLDAYIREFHRCATAVLEAGADRAGSLAACLGVDSTGRIARACDTQTPRPDKIRAAIAKRCGAAGVDLAEAFPACSASNAETLHACVHTAAIAAGCSMLDGAAALEQNCQ